MILSQLNIWCFLRGDRREDVVCSMIVCWFLRNKKVMLKLTEISISFCHLNHQIYFKHLIWGGNGCSSKKQMAADSFEPSKCQTWDKHLIKDMIALFHSVVAVMFTLACLLLQMSGKLLINSLLKMHRNESYLFKWANLLLLYKLLPRGSHHLPCRRKTVSSNAWTHSVDKADINKEQVPKIIQIFHF